MLEVDETFTMIWRSRSSEVRVNVRRWPQSLSRLFCINLLDQSLFFHSMVTELEAAAAVCFCRLSLLYIMHLRCTVMFLSFVVCQVLSCDVACLREMSSIISDSDVSSFEIIHSGLITKLISYLTTPTLTNDQSSCRNDQIRVFLHVFANCPVSCIIRRVVAS